MMETTQVLPLFYFQVLFKNIILELTMILILFVEFQVFVNPLLLQGSNILSEGSKFTDNKK